MRYASPLLMLLLACEPPAAASVANPPAATPERGDACRRDIPDCEAACALRETNRTEHLDWFDRRCAAVVLGKNPDKAVGCVPPEPVASATAPAQPMPNCDPPYTLDADGHKKWNPACLN